MEVEDQIKFLFDLHAKAEMRMAKSENRLIQAEARQAAADARVSAMEKRLDKRMDATNKLIQTGMRMLVNFQAENKRSFAEIDRKIDALVESQIRAEARTDRLEQTLQSFLDSLQRGADGKPKRRDGH